MPQLIQVYYDVHFPLIDGTKFRLHPFQIISNNKTAEASTHFTMRIGRLRMSNIFYKCT